jgi:hypothetical protein
MSIIKLAMNFKQAIRPMQRNKSLMGRNIALGASLGGFTGMTIGQVKNLKQHKDSSDTKNVLLGAGIGALAGSGIGALRGLGESIMSDHRKNFKKRSDHLFKNFNRDFGNAINPRKMIPDPSSFFKEHGNISHTLIKTKKQAKDIYRNASRVHHPDMGGNQEKFKDLSTNWESIKNSEWFNKLASCGLIKLAIQTLYQNNGEEDQQMIDPREEILNKNKINKLKQFSQPKLSFQNPSPVTQEMFINS